MTMQNIVEKLREEGRAEGRLAGARSALRRVLALRKLVPSRDDEAQIDVCSDLATLERWLDQAMAAQSVAEALREGDAQAVGNAVPRRRRSRSSS